MFPLSLFQRLIRHGKIIHRTKQSSLLISIELCQPSLNFCSQRDSSDRQPPSTTKTKGTNFAKSEEVRVVPRSKLDVTQATTERNFITLARAMGEYLLRPSDLEDLRKFQRRSPYATEPPINVYLRRDIETRALQVWQSWENLEKERRKRDALEEANNQSILSVKKLLKEYKRINDPERKRREEMAKTTSKVVVSAIMINLANCIVKFVAWYITASHSMFAEAIHSLADTLNQLILYYGVRKSIQTPDGAHPYGYTPAKYIASLISGVAIFFGGACLTIYHGVHAILHPEAISSLYWAFPILAGSLLSEGGTLILAFNAAKSGAKKSGLTFKEYVLRANDPSVNVVLLEDTAAVIGILVAASAMGLTYVFNNPIYDAIGSLIVGGLLGSVASFIVMTNSAVLVGRSIESSRLEEINKKLESDVMIRAIHDVKATEMGRELIRYKAEVDFDGRQLARRYLDTIDIQNLLKELENVKTVEEVEVFMLKHGENIVDMIGAEIDRIERELKVSSMSSVLEMFVFHQLMFFLSFCTEKTPGTSPCGLGGALSVTAANAICTLFPFCQP